MPHGSPALRAERDTPQPGDDESTVATPQRSPSARRWRFAATTAIVGATAFVTLALLVPRGALDQVLPMNPLRLNGIPAPRGF